MASQHTLQTCTRLYTSNIGMTIGIMTNSSVPQSHGVAADAHKHNTHMCAGEAVKLHIYCKKCTAVNLCSCTFTVTSNNKSRECTVLEHTGPCMCIMPCH